MGAQVTRPTKREVAQWNRFYQLSADPEKAAAHPVTVPVKRTYKASGNPLEKDILKAIMQLLKKHPKIAKVWRQNSGVFREGDRWIRANTATGMSDIMGVLKNGRMLAIEVKTETGVVKAHQHEFLNSIANAGGLAFVARSVDDVMEKLEAA